MTDHPFSPSLMSAMQTVGRLEDELAIARRDKDPIYELAVSSELVGAYARLLNDMEDEDHEEDQYELLHPGIYRMLQRAYGVALRKHYEVVALAVRSDFDRACRHCGTPLTDEKREKYLARAYRHASFPKPKNLLGLNKSLPPDDMRSLMESNMPVNADALRHLAERRAGAVQQWLKGKVEGSRVFVVAPKTDAKGIDDGGRTTRVDFGLH